MFVIVTVVKIETLLLQIEVEEAVFFAKIKQSLHLQLMVFLSSVLMSRGLVVYRSHCVNNTS